MASRPLTVFLASLLAVSASPLFGSDSNQDQILKPTKTNGAPKMLVFIPGANVPTENYLPTAKAIQDASNLELWVIIPSMPAKTCIMLCPSASICAPLHERISSVLDKAKSQGYTGAYTAPDSFVIGHSLGGICAQKLAQAYVSPAYQAVTLLGAYTEAVAGPGSPADFPIPVMTVGAELDGGLGRPAMINNRLRTSDAASKTNGTDWQISAAPVVILPGLDHSSFCPGFAVPGDVFPAEVTVTEAMNATGSIVAAFLHLHSDQPSAVLDAAKATITTAMKWTRDLIAPFEAAYQIEGGNNGNNHETSPWCATAQTILSGEPAAEHVKVNPVVYKDDGHEFEHTRIAYTPEGTSLVLNASGHNDYYSGIPSSCLVPAASIDCKMVGAERVAQQLNITNNTSPSCADVNKAAIEKATAILAQGSDTAKATLARFNSRGRKITLGADFAPLGNIGPLFLKGSLKIEDSPVGIKVSSIAIHTQLDSKLFPGVHYCKLLSPARVLDYMFTDSLKNASGCLNV